MDWKMNVHILKPVQRLNVLSIPVTNDIFIELEKLVPEFTRKQNGPRTGKAIFRKRTKLETLLEL